MDSDLEKTVVLDTAATTLATQESGRRGPAIIGELTPTGELSLSDARLKQVPKELLEDKWDRVLHLEAKHNEISSLENSPILGLSELRTLDLRSNRLEFIPEEIDLLRYLKVLRLDDNLISFLPKRLWGMSNLEALTLGKNSLFSIPPEISMLTRLKTLILSDNRVLAIPAEIGQLLNLLALSVHGNEFSVLPTSFQYLTQLKELSLDWFRYTSPPLSRVLKGHIGQRMIESLCGLCLQLQKQKIHTCTLVVFLRHFSEEDFSLTTVESVNKRSAMHLAAQEGDCGVIRGLLDAGMDLNVLDRDGFSPFCLALRYDRISCAKLLLESGTNVKTGGGVDGTPLHLAVLKQEPWLVRDLLKRGANVQGKDRDGNSPLHLVMMTFSKSPRKSLLIADLLLNAPGASVNLPNNERATPLHIAVKLGNVDAIKWILASNRRLEKLRRELFDVNAKGIRGFTPLHIATHGGHYEITRLLIEVGKAHVLVKNMDERTPKQIARKDLALVKYLIQAEKDELRALSNRVQSSVFTEEEEQSVRLPQVADVLDKLKPFAERYAAMYGLYCLQRVEDLREVANELPPESPLLPDSVYLLGQLCDGKSLPLLERLSTGAGGGSNLLHEETLNSVEKIRGASTQTIVMRAIMGPKLQRSEQVLRGCYSVKAFSTFTAEDGVKKNLKM